MFVGSPGIDPVHFGNGIQGPITYSSAQNLLGLGDFSATTLTMAGGTFIVRGAGQRYFATKKITIGAGVTLNGRSFLSNITGAPATTIGGGKDAGTGNTDGDGAAGTGSFHGVGGSGGVGGANFSALGGLGGAQADTNLKSSYNNFLAMLTGHGLVNGSYLPLEGGAGGGGGAGDGDAFGGNGGGGGGVIILAAPIIEIAGTIDVGGYSGSDAIAGSGPGSTAGGGGGGGGGLVILIYGTLILTGTININGGAGGVGFGTGGHGGHGGSGGQLWKFNGDPSQFTATHGSTGSNGADG